MEKRAYCFAGLEQRLLLFLLEQKKDMILRAHASRCAQLCSWSNFGAFGGARSRSWSAWGDSSQWISHNGTSFNNGYYICWGWAAGQSCSVW